MTPPNYALNGNRIRVGVAGLGAVAQAVHLPLLARLDDVFEIAALADLSPSLLARLGDRYRVAAADRVTSVEALLDRPGIDGLVILTSGSHGAAALAALGRGLAVLCEKPLATTLAECDRLAASPAADRLLLGYMKVFDPAVEEARRIAVDEAATLGELKAIDVTVLHPTSEAQLEFARLLPAAGDADPALLAGLGAEGDRLVEAALGSAAVAEIGPLYANLLLGSVVHDLSVIRAVTDESGPLAIDHVDVWPSAAWPPSVVVVGRLPSGVRVTIAWHFLDRYPAYREEVRFHHRGGSVELTFPSPYRLHEPTILAVETGGAETRRRTILDSIEEAFERELLAFAGIVRDGERPRTGIADGRTDIVTCQRIAAAWAARRGIEIGGEAAEAEG
ncbi:MAG TPA: Gfo/Idh/MocA family oxidoreductase [Candidatus Limnocylindrales bacterium]|nr:Gfo/Idh/MocA family oxidoreductase [Candidatus Limnocylindrales bacterium]